MSNEYHCIISTTQNDLSLRKFSLPINVAYSEITRNSYKDERETNSAMT